MRKRIIRIGIVLAVIATILGASYAYAAYGAVTKAAEQVTSSGKLADILTPEALDGESTGSVNILIAGNSSDDVGHGGAELTDSIMVAQYNLSAKKLSLISLPRDTWVSTDGSYTKLNAVYVLGGMQLLQSTVESITGLTINHSVLLNYQAVQTAVDAVGGIDVTIESGDARGIYDPMIGFSIANGTQHLTGEQALLLARSRNDPTYDGRIAYGLPNGDFDRMANQRKIILALLKKATTMTSLTDIPTFTGLIEDLSSNITTDLSIGQLRRIFDLSQTISATVTLSIRGDDSRPLLGDYVSYDGQAALVPTAGVNNYDEIQRYITAQIAG